MQENLGLLIQSKISEVLKTAFLPSEASKRRPSDPEGGEFAHFIEYFVKLFQDRTDFLTISTVEF